MTKRGNRIVGWVFLIAAAALAIFAVQNWRRSAVKESEFHAAAATRPVASAVDFSKAGEFRGVLQETYPLAHGQMVSLEVSPPFASDEEARRALAGLTLDWRLLATDGKPIVDGTVDASKEDSIPLLLAYPHPEARGQYPMILTVKEPAPGLAGRNQRVVSRYHLCGMELLPARLQKYFAIALGVVGLICLIAGIAFLRRPGRGNWRAPRSAMTVL